MSIFLLLLSLRAAGALQHSLDSRYPRMPHGAYAAQLRAQGAKEFPFKNFSAAYVAAALATPTDWVAKGAVTPVKDQGAHGYCGTFGRVAACEGQFAIKTGKLVSFSEQELVSCIGWDADQYSYFEAKGFMTSADFPYNTTGPDMDPPIPGAPCVFDPSKVVAGTPLFFNGSTGHATSEDQLAAFVHHNGPTTIGINADVFGKRAKGCEKTGDCFITKEMCAATSAQVDHSVTIVGYGVDAEKGPFWVRPSPHPPHTTTTNAAARLPAALISSRKPNSPPPQKIKNSWSTAFANGGYINLARGVACAGICDARTGSCGGGNLFIHGAGEAYYE